MQRSSGCKPCSYWRLSGAGSGGEFRLLVAPTLNCGSERRRRDRQSKHEWLRALAAGIGLPPWQHCASELKPLEQAGSRQCSCRPVLWHCTMSRSSSSVWSLMPGPTGCMGAQRMREFCCLRQRESPLRRDSSPEPPEHRPEAARPPCEPGWQAAGCAALSRSVDDRQLLECNNCIENQRRVAAVGRSHRLFAGGLPAANALPL